MTPCKQCGDAIKPKDQGQTHCAAHRQGKVRGKRHNVYMLEEDVVRAIAAGNGNISAGIRVALEKLLP